MFQRHGIPVGISEGELTESLVRPSELGPAVEAERWQIGPAAGQVRAVHPANMDCCPSCCPDHLGLWFKCSAAHRALGRRAGHRPVPVGEHGRADQPGGCRPQTEVFFCFHRPTPSTSAMRRAICEFFHPAGDWPAIVVLGGAGNPHHPVARRLRQQGGRTGGECLIDFAATVDCPPPI